MLHSRKSNRQCGLDLACEREIGVHTNSHLGILELIANTRRGRGIFQQKNTCDWPLRITFENSVLTTT